MVQMEKTLDVSEMSPYTVPLKTWPTESVIVRIISGEPRIAT